MPQRDMTPGTITATTTSSPTCSPDRSTLRHPTDGVTEMRPRDLVHIERRTVHREVYEGHIEMVGFTAGTGPGRIEATGETAHESQDSNETETDIADAFE